MEDKAFDFHRMDRHFWGFESPQHESDALVSEKDVASVLANVSAQRTFIIQKKLVG